jgi:hypothetical protein
MFACFKSGLNVSATPEPTSLSLQYTATEILVFEFKSAAQPLSIPPFKASIPPTNLMLPASIKHLSFVKKWSFIFLC